MKTILLAGGLGTRLSEYTEVMPKPMVPIGGKPILWHIMQRYALFGHDEFLVALGYKGEKIKEYFLNYRSLNSDFSVNLKTGDLTFFHQNSVPWTVSLIDTGSETMTGGRVKRLSKYVGNETFMLTYGDGLSDVDISNLIAFHTAHGKLVTMTAVRPAARFGELDLVDGRVVRFQEKPQLQQGWINGGFFVCSPKIFDFIDGDQTLLEREPLERLAAANQLMAYKHDGFWQCMDTKRDRETLEHLWHTDPKWITDKKRPKVS